MKPILIFRLPASKTAAKNSPFTIHHSQSYNRSLGLYCYFAKHSFFQHYSLWNVVVVVLPFYQAYAAIGYFNAGNIPITKATATAVEIVRFKAGKIREYFAFG